MKPSLSPSPVGAEWPSHKLDASNAEISELSLRPYRFLGHINFAEVHSVGIELPPDGLLSLFVQYDPEGELDFFWQDDSMDIPSDEELTHHSAPAGMNNAAATPIRFSSTIDIPHDKYRRDDWPFDFDDHYDAYNELRDSLHKSGEYLLGCPSHCSLAYNPTPGPEWMSLLTICSDDEWCWHDGDMLMVFIKKEHLFKRDFSSLRSDAG